MKNELEGYNFEVEDCPYMEGVPCDCQDICNNCTVFHQANDTFTPDN